MSRIGLDYAAVAALNPRIVYGSVSGYGEAGPWRDRPGQDLLAQSVSGLPWLNGHHDRGPVPVGLSIADLLASCHLAQGITALLLRRERTGAGGLVETSLLEGMLDLHSELLSVHLNDPSVSVCRGGEHGANAFLPAPYGTYPTSDGYLALAMNPLIRVGEPIGIDLSSYSDPRSWWSPREEIEQLLARHLSTATTEHWLGLLDPAGVWCAPVLSLPELVAHESFAAIEMTQTVECSPDLNDHGPGVRLTTTRGPLRVDGRPLLNHRGSPRLGEHSVAIRTEFGLADSDASPVQAVS